MTDARRRRYAVTIFAIVLLAATASAQDVSSEKQITGVVTDQLAGAVPAARVTLRDTAGTLISTGITDASGRFTLTVAAAVTTRRTSPPRSSTRRR